MDYEKALEAEQLFNELGKYQYPYISEKVTALREYFQPIIDNEKDKQTKKKYKLRYSYGKASPRELVQNALNAFSQSVALYEEANSNVEYCQRAIQDILHAMELLEASDKQLIEWARELKELRLIRREAKDFAELSQPLYQFAQKHKSIGKELGQIHGEVNKLYTKMDNRSYKVREKTSLAEAFEQAESLKLVK